MNTCTQNTWIEELSHEWRFWAPRTNRSREFKLQGERFQSYIEKEHYMIRIVQMWRVPRKNTLSLDASREVIQYFQRAHLHPSEEMKALYGYRKIKLLATPMGSIRAPGSSSPALSLNFLRYYSGISHLTPHFVLRGGVYISGSMEALKNSSFPKSVAHKSLLLYKICNLTPTL